jgi:hypothetical protein
MSTRAFVRCRSTRLFAAAAVLATLGASSVTAQDNNNGSTAPAQPAPPAIAPRLPGILKEPKVIIKAIDLAEDKFGDGTGRKKSGFYPELSNMQTGAGWISLGPGYRRYFDNDNVLVDTSAAVSWHLYNMAQARIEFPKIADEHVIMGVQGMWQDSTQVNYYGIGPDSLEADRSLYRFQSHELVGYATYQPRDWFTMTGDFGWIGRPRVLAPSGTFKPNFPDTTAVFPNDPGVSLPEQPPLLTSEASVYSDTRNHRGYPTRGALYRAALTHYIDRDTGVFSFRQWEAEGLQLLPVVADKWVLALRGWTVFGDVPTGHQIPFYLLPALGGNNSLRSYHSYRFHDNNLLVVNAESRLRVTEHIDAAVFADAGNVAGRFGDLNLDKTSYGAGLRLHTDRTTFARMDVAHGAEGWLFVFRTNDPLRLGRVRRQVALMPFAP